MLGPRARLCVPLSIPCASSSGCLLNWPCFSGFTLTAQISSLPPHVGISHDDLTFSLGYERNYMPSLRDLENIGSVREKISHHVEIGATRVWALLSGPLGVCVRVCVCVRACVCMCVHVCRKFGSASCTVSHMDFLKHQHVPILLSIFQKVLMDTEYFLTWIGPNLFNNTGSCLDLLLF